MKTTRTKFLGIAALLFAVCWSTAINAAGLLTPADSNQPPLTIREHHVEVVIEDGYAVTTVDQVFANPNGTDMEAVYSFPIPEKAALLIRNALTGLSHESA